MTPEEYRRRVDRERGTGTIRSFVGPWLLPCVWTECDHPARREHLFVTPPEGDGKILFYFFCSGRHRNLWINSVRDMGNLASGSKGMIS